MSSLRSDFERFPARIDNKISSAVDHVGEASSTVQRPRAPRFRATFQASNTVNSGGYSRMNRCALDDHYHVHTSPMQSHSGSLQPLARKRSATYALGDSLNLPEEYTADGGTSKKGGDKVVMTGWLNKMSRLKTSKTRGHRQHRRFKLTAHSLEYDQLFQKVSYVRHSNISHVIATCML